MRFQVLDILPLLTNPVTGREIRPDERFAQALTAVRYAEQFGFDAVALGERHAGHFLSSGIGGRYRREYAAHGHDPRHAYVGAGAGFLYLADTTQRAREAFGPTYERLVAYFNQPGNHTPGNAMVFASIEDAIVRGPVLVGSPQQVAEKILWFHEAYGHDPQSFSLPTMIPHEQQLHMLERLAAEVLPTVRAAAPTTLWSDEDPYGGRPAAHGRTVADAAAEVAAGRRAEAAR